MIREALLDCLSGRKNEWTWDAQTKTGKASPGRGSSSLIVNSPWSEYLNILEYAHIYDWQVVSWKSFLLLIIPYFYSFNIFTSLLFFSSSALLFLYVFVILYSGLMRGLNTDGGHQWLVKDPVWEAGKGKSPQVGGWKKKGKVPSESWEGPALSG